jgi:hypothetical protein
MFPPSITVHASPLARGTHIEDVSRRGLMVGSLTTLLFVACGSDHEKDEAPSPATTRTVDTPLGPVDMPLRPDRNSRPR